jgi:FSR family fosmidomycin resistance protein-like MFS transporter
MIAGFILQTMGLRGLPYTALAMTPIVVMMAIHLHEPIAEEPHHASRAAATTSNANTPRLTMTHGAYFVVAFILLIALRSTTQQTYTTLLPKHFDNLGILPATIGIMMGIYGFAGATGTLVGGYLGDRFNRRIVIFLAMLAGVPAAYLMLFPGSWTYYAAAIASGILLNIPHSILLIMAQRLLPKSKGMIGGAVLGFMFAAGAITAWIAGNFADSFGLQPVLSVVAFMPIGAGLCALVLPSTRGVPAPSSSAVVTTPAPETAR